MHTHSYSSIFLYLFLYIENHKSRLITQNLIPYHNKVHLFFLLLLICNYLLQWEPWLQSPLIYSFLTGKSSLFIRYFPVATRPAPLHVDPLTLLGLRNCTKLSFMWITPDLLRLWHPIPGTPLLTALASPSHLCSKTKP